MGFLSRFEGKMEDTFEGAADKMFDAPISPVQIAKKAEKQMRREKMVGAGKQYAPTLYTVLVNPDDDRRLMGYYPTLAGETETYLAAKASEQGLVMDGHPLVRFIVDEDLKHGKFEVIAEAVAAPIVAQLRSEEMQRYGLAAPAAPAGGYGAVPPQPRPFGARAPEASAMGGFGQRGAQGLDPGYDPRFDGARPAAPVGAHPDAYPGAAAAASRPGAYPGEAAAYPGVGEGAGRPAGSYADAGRVPDLSAQPPYTAGGPAGPPPTCDLDMYQELPYVPKDEIDYSVDYGEYTFDSRDFDDQRDSMPAPDVPRALDPFAYAEAAGVGAVPIRTAATPAPAPAPFQPAVAETVVFAAGPQAVAAVPSQAAVRARLVDTTNNRSYDLASTRLLIGRESKNDIAVQDVNASRTHAELRLGPQGAWTITDLGSTNGTLVNGREVASQPLSEGDCITIGMTNFVFTQA